MAGIARSPPRRHLACRHPCIPPLLVRLARLSTHLMGQRRWYHPLEEHFMLSSLTPAMCKTMAGLVCRVSRCRCLLLSQRLQPDSLAWFPATLLARAVDSPLGAYLIQPSLQPCTPLRATRTIPTSQPADSLAQPHNSQQQRPRTSCSIAANSSQPIVGGAARDTACVLRAIQLALSTPKSPDPR
jgi:hypothetical protein